jgi:hypothetical protein
MRVGTSSSFPVACVDRFDFESVYAIVKPGLADPHSSPSICHLTKASFVSIAVSAGSSLPCAPPSTRASQLSRHLDSLAMPAVQTL